jgi:beta-lactamase regulating signal transducer with metallopeptidase domain/protocatechuate 3,4-dioxygenase beta subunit/thiol-disulfide isomerase/thioredoxin
MIGFLNAASPATVALAIDAVAKATVLIVVALIAHAILGRRRVLARTALGNACLAGLLVIPLASWSLPRLRVAVLPSQVAASVEAPSPDRSGSILEEPTATESQSFVASPIIRPSTGPSEPRTIAGPSPDYFTRGTIAQTRPAERLSASGLVFGVYLAGVVLMLSRLAASLAAVARLRRRCEPIVEPVWLAARDRWKVWVGVKRRVALLASDRISVPIIVGVLRPAIILPRSLAKTEAPGLVDAILLHELSHIRRGDFGWNLVFKLVQVLYWPHPLIGPLGRIVRAVREQACDDYCVFAMGGAPEYRAALIAVASGLVRRPDPALGLAMAHTTNLGRRLSWIDRTRGASRCLPRWPARLGITAAVLSLAGLLGSIELAHATTKAAGEMPQSPASSDEKAKADANAPPPAIEVTVMARDTGKPLEGATVLPWIDLVPSERKTDREGRIQIDLSKRLFEDGLTLDVWADGYVQQRHPFSRNGVRNPRIPPRVTIELLPGEQTLGGKVIDEAGRPIAGAKVVIWGYLGAKKDKHELAYMVDTHTDQQGQWRCRCFRDMTFAYLFLSHPDYLSDDGSRPRKHGRPTPSTPAEPDERPMQALRDFTDVQVMPRGIAIAGRVSDQQGKPVSGAEVGWFEASQRGVPQDDMPMTTTDADGRFRFPHARPGRLMLQVKARGHAPELKPVGAKDGFEPVAVKLGPPRILIGRVVDSQDRPIADASISIHTWRGYRALGVLRKSGADGRFRWEDAPADPVLIDAGRVGYHSEPQQMVSPDHGEALVRLRRSFSISGRIRDAATDKPVDQAEVEVGIVDRETGKVSWRADPRAFADEGYLHVSLDAEISNKLRLRIKAKGYLPDESSIFDSNEGEAEYDARLTKTDEPQGVPISGVVVRPDGRPLEGALVTVTYPMMSTSGQRPLPRVQIENGTISQSGNPPIVQTDRQGRFRTAREPDPAGKYWAVVMVHPEWYAEVDRPAFERNATITARPWGRVEGFARFGAKPAAGATIRYDSDRLGNPDVPNVSDSGRAKADDRGHFVLERVAPGDLRVFFAFGENPSEMRSWSNGTLAEVKPGETAQVKLGGRGRPVVARIALPPGFDPKDDYTAYSTFEIQSDRPTIPFPRELFARRDGSMIGWGKRWWASPEGHEYRRNWFRLGHTKLQSDGTLRADDVPPGEYRLSLIFSADPIRDHRRSPERLALVTRQFTIPDGRDGEPFDLGILRPRPRQWLKVGEAAPPFEVESLDGRRLKLQDFRGKYLLLAFWATWCGPCIADLPELKAVHDRFSVDERFAMLSLSLDADKETPRKFAAEKALRWAQGFLGEWIEGGAQEGYHVEAIPAIFLIGPDGKLKAQGLRGDTLQAVIANALNEP